MDELTWVYKSFPELTVNELYDILRLRSEVFVVEQQCVYLDADYKDQASGHLYGIFKNKIVAYARILPPRLAFKEASIGRVSSSPSYRGKGAGRELMLRAIEITCKQFGVSVIRIGAQLYLNKFYSSLGFLPSGKEYMEDGIPHIEMLLSK